MTDHNDTTIKSYEEEYQIYVDKTAGEVVGSIKQFIDRFLAHVGTADPILEIGSGPGRDAIYIETRGYKVVRTDAAKSFVKHMIGQGYEADVLDIINDSLGVKFNAIFANAVFLHFDDKDFRRAVSNTKSMLNDNGIFALSLQKGNFRAVSDHKHRARYFHEWTEKQIIPLMTELGFEEIDSFEGESVSKRKKWIMLILKKSSA